MAVFAPWLEMLYYKGGTPHTTANSSEMINVRYTPSHFLTAIHTREKCPQYYIKIEGRTVDMKYDVSVNDKLDVFSMK